MNALRSTAATFTPAARRALSSAATTGKAGASFKDIWAVAEAVPLVVMVVIPSTFAVYTTSKFATTHNECQWSKVTKSKGVAAWYEGKYPGTNPIATSGAKYTHSH